MKHLKNVKIIYSLEISILLSPLINHNYHDISFINSLIHRNNNSDFLENDKNQFINNFILFLTFY